MREMIHDIFLAEFNNEILSAGTDSAILNMPSEHIAFTTDSFVIDPIFFPGGDIGKLAICGTVNDLAVSGAEAKYLTCSLILEEGFAFNDLQKIIKSMAEAAQEAGVKVVTGDTKVVNRGKCDKIFINTSGIGILDIKYKEISFGTGIIPGDKIIVSGTLGDHGMAVLKAREDIKINADMVSDCAPLNGMIKKILDADCNIKFMRDATRGGLATVLNELVEDGKYGISVEEDAIPVNENVRGMCEIFGFDPLYVANEGKIVIIASANSADTVINTLRNNKYGKNAAIIGEVTEDQKGKVILETSIGGKRVIDMLAGEQLPRIC